MILIFYGDFLLLYYLLHSCHYYYCTSSFYEPMGRRRDDVRTSCYVGKRYTHIGTGVRRRRTVLVLQVAVSTT